MRIVLASRSAHKAEEIRRILPAVTLQTLDDLEIEESAAEDEVEAFDTFRLNALAKARHFAAITGMPTLADDSGLVVPALDGAPGVYSKRFAQRAEDAGEAPRFPEGLSIDQRNNALLLERLSRMPDADRSAYYVCAAAAVRPEGIALVAIGTTHGVIAAEPIGDGGFGYDPLFFVPPLDRTFAQATSAEKDRRSHRARAFRALQPRLSALFRH